MSLYKTRKSKSFKTKIKANEESSNLEDTKQNFKIELMSLENNINSAYNNYSIINKTIIPLKQKMQKNIENYNSLSGLKPQIAYTNLNELISYELKSMNN